MFLVSNEKYGTLSINEFKNNFLDHSHYFKCQCDKQFFSKSGSCSNQMLSLFGKVFLQIAVEIKRTKSLIICIYENLNGNTMGLRPISRLRLKNGLPTLILQDRKRKGGDSNFGST